ncbi:MAG: hypothetical protein AB7P40_14230 [Chloroflexota bacterium]
MLGSTVYERRAAIVHHQASRASQSSIGALPRPLSERARTLVLLAVLVCLPWAALLPLRPDDGPAQTFTDAAALDARMPAAEQLRLPRHLTNSALASHAPGAHASSTSSRSHGAIQCIEPARSCDLLTLSSGDARLGLSATGLRIRYRTVDRLTDGPPRWQQVTPEIVPEPPRRNSA